MTNHEVNMIRLQVLEVELLRLHARKKVVDEQANPEVSNLFINLSRFEQARLNYEIVKIGG